MLKLLVELRVPRAQAASPTASGSARGWSASARSRRRRILLTDVPDDYIQISSGLGEAPPLNIIVLPVLFEGEVKAVIELASFQPLQPRSTRPSSISSPSRSASSSTRSPPTCAPRSCSSSRSRSPRSCAAQQAGADRDQQAARAAGQVAARPPRTRLQASSRKSCSRPTRSSRRRRSCSPSRTRRSSARTARSSRRGARSRRRRSSSRSRRSTSREFLANMSHELRTPLNSCSSSPSCSPTTPTATSTTKQVEFAQDDPRGGRRPARR